MNEHDKYLFQVTFGSQKFKIEGTLKDAKYLCVFIAHKFHELPWLWLFNPTRKDSPWMCVKQFHGCISCDVEDDVDLK